MLFGSPGAALRDRLRDQEPGKPEALEARRDLPFELLEAARIADTAHRNAPDAARVRWRRHLELQHEGCALLASCWSLGR